MLDIFTYMISLSNLKKSLKNFFEAHYLQVIVFDFFNYCFFYYLSVI